MCQGRHGTANAPCMITTLYVSGQTWDIQCPLHDHDFVCVMADIEQPMPLALSRLCMCQCRHGTANAHAVLRLLGVFHDVLFGRANAPCMITTLYASGQTWDSQCSLNDHDFACVRADMGQSMPLA